MDNVVGTRTKLKFVPDQVYECIKCGNCCGDFWEFPIDKVSAEIIKNDINLCKIQYSKKQEFPICEGSINKGSPCLRINNGTCVFLDLQKICLIHKHLGYETKPQRCKDYPFIYVNTPGGVYVSVRSSCYSNIREKGIPLEKYEIQLQNNLELSESIYEIKRPIKLSERLEIPWSAYEKIEKGLIDFLNVEVYSIDDRLVGGNIFLNLLEEFILEAIKNPENTIDLIIDGYIENIRKQNYAQIIKIAQKPVFSSSMHRMICGLLVNFRNSIRQQYGTAATLLKVSSSHFKYYFKRGKIQMLPVTTSFSFNDFSSVRFIMEEPYYNFQLLRFAKQQLVSKTPLINYSLIRGYNYILLLAALIRWYCIALTAEKSEVDVSREDINLALEYVDKYYGFTSLLPRITERYPVIEDTINRIFDRKNYAPSIIRGNRY